VLRIGKSVPEMCIVNVPSAVYEVFDMTGFVELFSITKAYRRVSVEGCEVLGQGANGKVYRVDADTAVKVYYSKDALPEIERERMFARTAFVRGLPTAIPYDVVRVGDSYGSCYEMLNAETFAELLISGEKTVEEIAELSVDLLRQIHATLADTTIMPSMRDVVLDWARFLTDYLEPELGEKLVSLVAAVPEDDHMLHGDYHIKNVMMQDGECLLIDLDTLCHGHPIFELASMYNAYVGFGETDHEVTHAFLGIDFETAGELWERMLHLYLAGQPDEVVESVRAKAIIAGSMRIMRRSIRRGGLDTEAGRRTIEACRAHLAELLPQVDTLLF
jgi:uncharacterized protein (TIGR02172 family)